MELLYLSRGKFTIIDPQDFHYLNRWKWYLTTGGYAVRNINLENGKRGIVYMHKVIAKSPDGLETDHINGNTLDNRRANLRNCTHKENTRNRKMQINNTSGHKGVYWHSQVCKWQARICVDGRSKSLGMFADKLDAAKAYDKAAKKAFGVFIR